MYNLNPIPVKHPHLPGFEQVPGDFFFKVGKHFVCERECVSVPRPV